MFISNPKFTKSGIVIVGGDDPINLQDPIGEITQICLDHSSRIIRIEVKASDGDGRNEVSRWYNIELDEQAWNNYLISFVAPEVNRLMRDGFEEFQGLQPYAE